MKDWYKGAKFRHGGMAHSKSLGRVDTLLSPIRSVSWSKRHVTGQTAILSRTAPNGPTRLKKILKSTRFFGIHIR